MANLQEQVTQICKLADNVLKKPSIPVFTTANAIGASAGVMGFIGQVGLLAPIAMGPVVGGGIALVLSMLLRKRAEQKKKEQEKERMLREVIRKQQAIIKKLEEENKRHKQANARNEQEIRNLREMLDILERTEEQIKAA